ncbi:MAG: flippase-like domain-containing protein [Candidatus Atribacteria bacterium]|nr:flippase-like domain-containing protein [Candidatus Atribacteria bacterium]
MRKIVIVIVLLLGIALVFFSFAELKNISETLKHSNWRFLAVALFFECLWLYNVAITYGVLYRLVGLHEDKKRLLLVSTAATFVNVIAPTAGIGGMAVFLDDAKRRNHSSGRVTVVGALFVLFDYVAFLCVLALGWVVLIRRNNLNAGEITASLILLGLAIAFAVLIYLGYRSATALGNALAWMTRLVNRVLRPFIHREYLNEGRAHEFAAEMAEGLSTIRGRKRNLIWPFLFALNSKALLICVLAFTFLAFGTPFTVGTLVGGFSIGYLFLIVSPTPSGLGIVEGMLTVALNTLRVKLDAAVLITLIYRALTFWFPLAVGGVAFRLLQGKPKEKPSVVNH